MLDSLLALLAAPMLASDGSLEAHAVPRRLPAAFVANAGQEDAAVRFRSAGRDSTAWFTDAGFTLGLRDAEGGGAAVRFTFEGASGAPAIEGADPIETRYRFFRGADPSRWAEATGYASIRYRGLYPDVDLSFRSTDGKLEYDLDAGPHADVGQVVVRCEGATSLAIADDGALEIATAAGTLRQAAPRTVRIGSDGARVAVESRFRLVDASRFAFDVGAREPGESLRIDPSLSYSTYLEGTVDEYGKGLAVDANGVVTLVGLTMSANFPTTVGAYDTSFNGNYDAVILKVNAAGSGLASATFFGGNNDDRAFGVAVDAAGNTYVTGITKSANFPATGGAMATVLKGASDAYVAKFNSAGGLSFATYLGGTGADTGLGIAVDSSDRAVVAGDTFSSDFPTSAGCFDNTFGGSTAGAHGDAFVARVNATGSALVSGTYLGGSSDDVGNGIALDPDGNAWITGNAGSAGFPSTAGAADSSFNGGPSDAYVACVDPAAALLFATFAGGTGNDVANSIAMLPAGGALIAASTGSANFPVTPGAFDVSFNGSTFDAAVVRVDATGASLAYATFLGGGQKDFGQAVAADGAGRAYLTGNTNSVDFPTTPGAWDMTPNGNNDLYVARLDPTGATLSYSSLIGGTGEEFDYAIALDPAGGVYFTGYTAGSYPTTAGAFQTAPQGANDAVLSKFNLCTGSFSAYGSGCAGSGGIVPVLAGAGCPAGGFDVNLTISQGLGGATALLFIGVGQNTLPVIPTCALQIGPFVPEITITVPLFGAGPGGGSIALTGAIPPESIPFDVYLQALVGDPGGNGHIASTNPIKMHIGP